MDFGFWILDFGFWILDFGSWILDFGFWILDFGFWILDFGFWILDLGFWILEFGFWILDQFSLRSFCGGPKRRRLDFGFWSLDFGFWSLDFGFWILEFGVWSLDFGVWSLDFGFWSLEFGFWILDFGLDEALPDIVWILHKIFPCHADSGRRIGGVRYCESKSLYQYGISIVCLHISLTKEQGDPLLKVTRDLYICSMYKIHSYTVTPKCFPISI